MPDEQTERQGGSFIVRIWWERGEGQAAQHWRGWIKHVRTGRAISFQSVDAVTRFIEQELGIHSTVEDASQGLG